MSPRRTAAKTSIRTVKAVKTTETPFERIVHQAPGVVYQFELLPDGDLRVPFLSDRALHLWGLTPEEVEADPACIFQFFHPDDAMRMRAEMIRSAETLCLFDFTGRIQTTKGDIKWIKAKSTPERRPDGTVVWDGIIFDISKEIALQAELDASRLEAFHTSKLAAVGEMAAGIGHEINNPLAIIQGFAEQIEKHLRAGKPETDVLLGYSAKIIDASERISRIVRTLKTFSPSDSNKPVEQRPISQIIEDVLDLCREKFGSHGVRLDATGIQTASVTPLAPLELGHVFLNLLNNAFHAVRLLNKPWIRIEMKLKEDFVEVAVTDSGDGIPAAIQDKLGQPFFTTKRPGVGTGLGLSISRRIVEKYGGRLNLNPNELNTQFVLRFPIAAPKL